MPTITVGANTGNTYSGVTDTAFDSTNTGTNYGTGTVINATKFTSGDHQHSAVKFGGLSNITGPVTVSSATIWLNVNDGEPFSTTVDMRRLLVSFDESTANWNNRSTGTPWGTAGGIGDGTDREATVVASKAVDNTSYSAQGVYQAFTSSGLASLVEGWINGTTTNNGVHIERNGAGNDGLYLRFKSSNAADGSRPYLELTYAAGGAPTITGRAILLGAGH